jgi:hypothetical protein
MSYYPTQPFSVGVCLFCLFSLSLSHLCDSLYPSLSAGAHSAAFPKFLSMKKQMGLFVSANYYPCQTTELFFSFFFKFIFW